MPQSPKPPAQICHAVLEQAFERGLGVWDIASSPWDGSPEWFRAQPWRI
jgi:hypothetical protein